MKLARVFARLGVVLSAALLVAGAARPAGTALPQQDRDAAEGALRALLNAQAEAWNRGDITAFLEGYWRSDQTTFAGAGGILRGWSALAERYHRNYPDRSGMGRLEFSELEITPLAPDAALVLGHWQLTREGDRPGGVFTLVARRLPEGWRIIHDHTSLVSPPPGAER